MVEYMCANCGATEWYRDVSYTSTRRYYSSRDEGTDHDDEYLDDGDEGDSDDERCNACESTDLLDIEGFDDEVVEFLQKLPSVEDREIAYKELTLGLITLDEVKAHYEKHWKKEQAPRVGKLIGGVSTQ